MLPVLGARGSPEGAPHEGAPHEGAIVNFAATSLQLRCTDEGSRTYAQLLPTLFFDVLGAVGYANRKPRVPAGGFLWSGFRGVRAPMCQLPFGSQAQRGFGAGNFGCSSPRGRKRSIDRRRLSREERFVGLCKWFSTPDAQRGETADGWGTRGVEGLGQNRGQVA